jgi:exo-1,4-beta-D-glucosaminidase
MIGSSRILLCLFIASSLVSFAQTANPPTPVTPHFALDKGWAIQISSKVNQPGEVVSSQEFKPENWIPTKIPSTVVAAQIAAGEFPDPFLGMNLRQLPGMTYKIGDIFNMRPMDSQSPYATSWWYRTTFRVPAAYAGKQVALHFKGINNHANIWLNGKKLADADHVAGAYRIYDFDVTSGLAPHGDNVLALEISAPTERDLGINFVDWNPAPPDKNMGIWGDVYLTASGPVTVRYPQVATHFPGDPALEADLTVRADFHNATDHQVHGFAEVTFGKALLRKDVTLEAGETRSVEFSPELHKELRVKQPKLWWPVHMGAPVLQQMTVRYTVNGRLSDEQKVRFGIREITSELTEHGHRLFRVNGKKVLIRGAAWAQDMFLRRSPEKLEAQLQYVRAMNLNTIRLEGQLEFDSFFDRTDELGLLVMAGWCCCDMWEGWKYWTPDTLTAATQSLHDQILRLRSHSSVFVWLNGSDGPPPADVETAYLKVLHDTGWPNPSLSSAAIDSTTVTGPSGVKMTGPYDYVPPSYWSTDTKYGGAYGFNTETSPGPAPVVEESLRKMLPPDHLWPIDDVWNYHTGGERFMTLNLLNGAMDNTYGKPASLEEYIRKSQAMTYDGERAMFEAYARNKYTSTGVIQWMLQNAWPSLIWHLYDYYLQPAGGYFGTKKACEPLHVQYSYDDRSVVIVSSLPQTSTNLMVSAHVYDVAMKEIFAHEEQAILEGDGVRKVFDIPAFPDQPEATVYFLKLLMRDVHGKEISSNFYWLPAKLSTMAWDKTPDTAYTPIATFEDMTALNHLPQVRLQATARLAPGQNATSVLVTLRNLDKYLAFQVRLAVNQGPSGGEVLPVLWDDNYVTLLPGESKVVRATYLTAQRPKSGAVLKVDGWNFDPVTVRLSPAVGNAAGAAGN